MNYVIGDIHNELAKLQDILQQIHLSEEDHLFFLGDLFDRGGAGADPVGVYFEYVRYRKQTTWIRGNHDQWLAQYIERYYALPPRKRKKAEPFTYNSFELLIQRLTEADILNIAEEIRTLPLQAEVEVNGVTYCMGHAMTTDPMKPSISFEEHLMGNMEMGSFFEKGVEGYVSLCGHTPTMNIMYPKDGRYLDPDEKSIWVNHRENVYLLDCGCGFGGGRLACMCLETGERFYSPK